VHCVVTGAAGFIGGHLSRALLRAGHYVVGVDSFTDYYDVSVKEATAAELTRLPNFELVREDMLSADLAELIDGSDVVFHLAGQPGVRLSWAEHFETYSARNISASHRLLEAARHAKVERLVMASSSSVYGNAARYPTTENSPTRPFSPYGVTKLGMEHLGRAYAENFGVRTVALRYFSVYGPGQRPDMGLHSFIERALAGDELELYGDGTQRRDFTYVEDVVSATIAAAHAPMSKFSVINVAGGSPVQVKDVLALISQITETPLRIRTRPEQPGDVRVTGGSIDRAKRMLDWAPRMPLADGLSRQVSWHLSRRRESHVPLEVRTP
jgi:UDP-glucuronate 4-epimerase